MRFLRLLAAAAALILAVPVLANAQSYPTTAPTYIPNAVLASQSLTATGVSKSFIAQGLGVSTVKIGGTFSVLAATVQATNDPTSIADTSATWVTLNVYPYSTGSQTPVSTLTAAGTYRVDAAGFTRIRLNVSSLTGTNVTVNFSGNQAGFFKVQQNLDVGNLLSLTAQGAGTLNSTALINDDGKGATCTLSVTTSGGTPSSTFGIQEYDVASSTWFTVLTSAAVTTTGTYKVSVYPGLLASAVPASSTGMNWHLGRQFRAFVTVGGTTPAVTGTLGCNVLN